MTTSRSQIKASGFWDLPTDPWTQSVGFFFQWEQGLPYQRFYFAENPYGSGGNYSLYIEPRGQYLRFGSFWELSLRFRQAIDIRKGRLVIDLEAQNVTNNRAPSSIFTQPLFQNGRFVSGGRQTPLRFQFGLRYEF
jgi:hypothetical protein